MNYTIALLLGLAVALILLIKLKFKNEHSRNLNIIQHLLLIGQPIPLAKFRKAEQNIIMKYTAGHYPIFNLSFTPSGTYVYITDFGTLYYKNG